ncbi:MAG: hypothetical protein U9N38_01535 [Thermodesulfobacteriota bacterium]|nr:hypothetical protein [Thermodesulfobacteriota bacterium]
MRRFDELEQKIKGFVEEYSALKEQNLELGKLLELKRAELEDLNDRIQSLNNEKDAVRTKVDILLDMLCDVDVPQD